MGQTSVFTIVLDVRFPAPRQQNSSAVKMLLKGPESNQNCSYVLKKNKGKKKKKIVIKKNNLREHQ